MLTVRITGVQPGEDGDARVVDVTQQGAWLMMACGTTTPEGEGREAVEGRVFLEGSLGSSELVLLLNGLIHSMGPERVSRAFAKAMARQFEVAAEWEE